MNGAIRTALCLASMLKIMLLSAILVPGAWYIYILGI